MSWFKLKAQPKDERPPLQGYGDNLQGSDGKESPFPVYYRSPVVPAPRANPSIITEYGGRPPRPRVDLDLIGDYYQ